MMLNLFALTSIFTGTVSLLLLLSGAATALHYNRRLRLSEGHDERARLQSRIHLSLILVSTALILRLASWPLFYMLLQSQVPLVPGAMCIYGVTRVMPVFVTFLEILKPVAFFLAGGWLILYLFDVSTKTRPLIRKCIGLMVAVASIASIDGAAELLYIFRFSPPGLAVSCCTAISDLAIPPSPILPVPLLALEYGHILQAGYHGLNLLLIGCTGYLWRRAKSTGKPEPGGFLLLCPAVLAFINGLVSYAAFKECLGPRLMRLPDHHCLYCLLQYRPVSIIILGLLVFGSFCAVWPFWLHSAAGRDIAGNRPKLPSGALFGAAFFCLSVSWGMTTVLCILG